MERAPFCLSVMGALPLVVRTTEGLLDQGMPPPFVSAAVVLGAQRGGPQMAQEGSVGLGGPRGQGGPRAGLERPRKPAGGYGGPRGGGAAGPRGGPRAAAG